MKIDINQTVKEIMQWKEQLGEFSLDLYYDDCSHWISYVAKLHSVCYKTFCHHERAADFDTAVIKTKAYLREIIDSGLTIADLVRDPRLAPGQRQRGGTSHISINKAMEEATREAWESPVTQEQFEAAVRTFCDKHKRTDPTFCSAIAKYGSKIHRDIAERNMYTAIIFCDAPHLVESCFGVEALKDHLRNTLHNDYIRVAFTQAVTPANVEAYADADKFRQLASEKPSLTMMERELFSDEAFAKRECECNGYKFHPKPFVCRRCGTVNDATFRWVEGNRSIQQRCAGCDAYITCVKYDPRDTGDKNNDPIYKP